MRDNTTAGAVKQRIAVNTRERDRLTKCIEADQEWLARLEQKEDA